jgi:hypothetical protein
VPGGPESGYIAVIRGRHDWGSNKQSAGTTVAKWRTDFIGFMGQNWIMKIQFMINHANLLKKERKRETRFLK